MSGGVVLKKEKERGERGEITWTVCLVLCSMSRTDFQLVRITHFPGSSLNILSK